MIETFAPSTGDPLSRRVTKISVFCGLSFTVMPRLVTWTIDARVCGFASMPAARRDCGIGCTFADGGPDEARPSRAERLRQIETVRLNAIGGDRESAVHSLSSRSRVKPVVLKQPDRGHELVQLDTSDPLPDVKKVSRVERQRRTTVLLPHPVTIAKARERAAMPVVHDPSPGISEHLPVTRA